MAEGEIKRGTVKWYSVERGFGFIAADDGSADMFVHQSAIRCDGFRSLEEGEAVEFQVKYCDDGRARAVNVTGPDGASVRGSIILKGRRDRFRELCQQFDRLNIDYGVTLCLVVSQIFEKAIVEPSLCEMYANVCFHLAADLPDLSVGNEKITFKRLLLNKCQEEFERGEREAEEANKADDEGEVKQTEEERVGAQRRMLGCVRFIGELYKMRMLTERIMHECISKLLGSNQNPDDKNIEALCILMSTIGEMIDHPKSKDHMDAYFDVMTQLADNAKLSSRVRLMLKDAIDLRKNKWQQRRQVDGPKKIEEVHRDGKGACAPMFSHSQPCAGYGDDSIKLDPVAHLREASSPPDAHRMLPEVLLYKSMAAIKKFYSARDEKEVTLCIKDFNAPSSYPTMISLWLTDSFERKDRERDLLTKLLINLSKPDGIMSRHHLIKGFELVLALLEDAVTDAPRAAEYLGCTFAEVVLEDTVSLSEIGRLIDEGGKEQGRLVEISLAAEVMGSLLDTIKSKRGDSVLNEILAGSNVQLEKFQPSRSYRIDKYM